MVRRRTELFKSIFCGGEKSAWYTNQMTVILLKSHIVKYQLDFRRLSLSKDPNPMLFVVNLSATLEPRNRKSLQIVLDVLSVEVLSYCSLSRGLIIGNSDIKQRACLDVYRPDNFWKMTRSPNSWAGVQSMIVVGSGSESTHWGEDTNLINV